MHWLLYGEWKIDVPKAYCRPIILKKGNVQETCVEAVSSEETELVATPFIVGGYNQRIKKEVD